MNKLLFSLLFFVSTTSILNAQTFEYEGITYQIIKDVDETNTYGTVYVTISEGEEYEGDIIIPNGVTNGDGEFADQYKVVGIDEQAFADCLSLKTVTLSPSVSHIGVCAFLGSSNLEEVIIPEGNLKIIGDRAFMFCGIKRIIIPSSVTTIAQAAFSGCQRLEEVTLSPNLKTIKMGAFNGCTKIKSIQFPKGLKSIGSMAFMGCSSLKKTNIPAETNVADDAFYNCPLWK